MLNYDACIYLYIFKNNFSNLVIIEIIVHVYVFI